MPLNPLSMPQSLCSAACLMALASSAWCAEKPGWTWEVTQMFSHDNNLFRLADHTAPGPGAPRSDTLSTTALDLSLDQPLGRQRLALHAGLQALRYRLHDELDHDAHHAGVRLDWETVGRWSGQLRGTSARSLRPLDPQAASGARARNLETTQEAAALARLGGAGALSVEAQLGGRGVNFSDPDFDAAELRTSSASAGLRWRPGGATTLGSAWRETRGRYVNSAEDDDRYRSRALDFWVTWSASAAQRLYLRASPLRVRYDRRAERDFSGLTGALAWRWQPRSPWRVTLRAVRDLGQDAYLERYGLDDAAAQAMPGGHLDDGVVLSRLSLAADRAVTAKVQAFASVGWTRRTLTRALAAPFNGGSITAHDTTAHAAVGARWEPRRRTELGCDASAERRQADSVLSTPYAARTVSCFGRLGW